VISGFHRDGRLESHRASRRPPRGAERDDDESGGDDRERQRIGGRRVKEHRANEARGPEPAREANSDARGDEFADP
jgi:hypothetical protein